MGNFDIFCCRSRLLVVICDKNVRTVDSGLLLLFCSFSTPPPPPIPFSFIHTPPPFCARNLDKRFKPSSVQYKVYEKASTEVHHFFGRQFSEQFQVRHSEGITQRQAMGSWYTIFGFFSRMIITLCCLLLENQVFMCFLRF